MSPAAEGLRQVLSGVQVEPLSIPVITNVDASVNLDSARVKSLLVEQAVKPVRWEESVRKLDALDCGRAWEIGPGKVLKGLIKRIVPSMEVETIETPQDFAKLTAGASA